MKNLGDVFQLSQGGDHCCGICLAADFCRDFYTYSNKIPADAAVRRVFGAAPRENDGKLKNLKKVEV